jgi:serine/threonine-protein kinase
MSVPLGSRYELDAPVGRGTTGQVWTGRRLGDGQRVAVKVLRSDLATDPDIVARFLQERAVLMGIVNANVVRVHDLVVEGDTLGIVMDLVEGPSLRALLDRDGPLAPALACTLVSQVCQGLAAVHAAGVVHRDVKPENVLVDMSVPGWPVAKLTDLGIAHLAHGRSFTQALGMVGTPLYMAPEIGDQGASPASDIYSAGVVLFEAITGHPPFGGPNPVAVLMAHVEQPATVPRPWSCRCLWPGHNFARSYPPVRY